ncbi:MAG: toprim domain-containing protein [Aliarcobacter sp.]
MNNVSEIMETACAFFQKNLGIDTRKFLHARYGFTDQTIDQSRIGYAPCNREALVLAMMNAGFTGRDIRDSGLFAHGPDYIFPLWQGRIMFPYLIDGYPIYFIGRRTEETTDPLQGKYIKQKKDGIAKEPIFGTDTVKGGKPLIITEGIADCISAHQAGFSAISPVTVRFKKEHADAMYHLCRLASRVYIIMDSEENNAGLKGAVDTGLALSHHGILPYLCTIPRPPGIEKVDLNDYIRTGNNPEALFSTATYVEDHPLAQEARDEQLAQAAVKLRSAALREKFKTQRPKRKTAVSGKVKAYDIKDEIIRAIPPLSSLVGFEGLGPHPVYGSKTGCNLNVSGDLWYCHHAGSKGGGDALKWIACYELNLIKEDDDLRGSNFIETLEYCADRWLPGWRDR